MKGRYFNKNTIELKLYEKGDKLVQFLSIFQTFALGSKQLMEKIKFKQKTIHTVAR